MKKFISLLLALTVAMATAVSAAPAFGGGGNTAPAAGGSSVTSAPDFTDDFTVDSGAWNLGYDFSIKDGTLYAKRDTYAYCSTLYDGWENFNLEFDFTIKEMTTFEDKGFWFAVNLRGTNYMFMRTQMQYNSPETGVQTGIPISTPLEDDVVYNVKIEASEKKGVVYLKRATENKFEKLGTMPISQPKGKIGFESYPAGIAYDNVKVWDITERPVKFKQMSTKINVGESAKLEVENKSGESLTFESADTAIATVSTDGTVTAVAAGKVEIRAKNASGYVATTTVVANVPVTAINLCTYERELYVNDSINFSATISPANATDKNLKWRIGNEGVIEIVGEATTAKGIKAVGVGTAELFVSNSDGTIEQSCVFTVKERPALETGEAVFAMKGISHKIPEYKFGLSTHGGQSAIEHSASPEGLHKMAELTEKVVKDVGFVHLKPFMNTYDPLTGWTNNGRERPEGVGPYYVSDFVDAVDNAGILVVWDAAITTHPTGKASDGVNNVDVYLDTQIDVLKEIRELTPAEIPLYVVFTPEAYAMHYESWLPRVDDYINVYRQLSKRIKTEVDPNAKLAVTVIAPSSYRAIIADPNNWSRWDGDLEYTQGWRIEEWHRSLAEDQSWFDAIDMHAYVSPMPWTDVNITADDFLHGEITVTNYNYHQGLNEIARLFPDKEVWDTEFNAFDMQFSKGSSEEMGRANTQKTVGSSLVAIKAIVEQMVNEDIKIASYFIIHDVQGFGMVQGDYDNPVYLPYYYAVKAGGDVFGANSGNTHAYPLTLAAGKVIEDVVVMNDDSELTNGMEAYAYGFGDENTMKDVMFINPNYKTMRVKITDSKLKKTLCFKPKKADQPYHDFYVRETAYVDYDVDSVPPPETYTDGTFEEYIELPPYSLVTAEVECASQKASVPEKAKGALVLKAGSSKAIMPDGFTRGVDAVNAEVTPIITPEGRTMVPMRIAAEAFKAVTIWNGKEKAIGVEAPNYRIDMKIGSNELIRDFESIRDGDEETFTLDVAPQILGGRTMVPLRALSEAMEKTVFWDAETKLIVISEDELGLSRDELNSLSAIIG